MTKEKTDDGKKPWAKFYFHDFTSDPKVKQCCRPARSFWLDLLGIMHEAEPYGHLLIAGRAPTTKQLVTQFGDSERDVSRWLAELEANQVFSRTPDNVIYSRRMVRDARRAAINKENGKGGGNPTLKGSDNRTRDRSNNRPDNPTARNRITEPDNQVGKPQRSEVRDLGPYKGLSPDQTRGRADVREAPAPPAQSEPGWELENERWSEVRKRVGDNKWSVWFQRCRLNGNDTTLIAPSAFEADKIRNDFGDLLAEVFGEEVTVKVEGR